MIQWKSNGAAAAKSRNGNDYKRNHQKCKYQDRIYGEQFILTHNSLPSCPALVPGH